MKRTVLSLIALFLGLFSFGQEVMITGYIDASCPQAKGRTLEIYVSGTVDFADYHLVRQSNGNGYTFNINIAALGTVTDDFVYITNDTDIFLQEFNFDNAHILQSGSINDNGDDAFQITDSSGQVIDRFGEENVQPVNGDAWYHQKTFYYRKDGETANSGNFNPENWTFGEVGWLNGKGICNQGEAYENYVPFGTFNPLICEPVTNLPYTENFEDLTPPAIRACTAIENTGNGNSWETKAIYTNGFDSNVMAYQAAPTANASAWFFTQGVALEAGTAYQIQFKYGNNDASAVEKLQMTIGSAQNSSAMEVLFDEDEIHSATAKWARKTFIPEESEVYYLGFKAYSNAGQNELYLDDISIAVLPDCPEPLNLTAEEVGQNSVTISWFSEEEVEEWEVIYGLTGFDPDSEGSSLYAEEISDILLENLNPDTSYSVYVKSLCSENQESILSEELTFKTLCLPISLPFTEDFEDIETPTIPDCAITQNLSAGHDWETALINDHGFSGRVLTYQSHPSQPAKAWYFMQAAELEGQTAYQLSYTYGNNATDFTEKLKVAVGSYPDAEAMEVLATHPAVTGAEATGHQIVFEPDEDGLFYFGFQAYSDPGQGALYLDHITLKTAPLCPEPAPVTVSDITSNSAVISWFSIPENTHWEAVYGLVGFNPQSQGQSVLIEGVTMATLENLEPGTDYQVYLRMKCENDDWSNFSTPTSFTTLCGALSIPYYEDFESVSPPGLPNCTTVENLGNGNNWETYDESMEEQPVFDSKVLRYEFDMNYGADTWFFTPGIALEAGVNYQLNYRTGNNTSNTNLFEKLKVGMGFDRQAEAMSILNDHPHITGGQAEVYSVVFAVESDGVYYFGFNAYSNFNAATLYLDDIEIIPGPGCPTPFNLGYTNLNHESVDVYWGTGGNPTLWELTFGYSGFDPDSEGLAYLEVESPEATLTGLESETAYEFLVRSLCQNPENSEWSSPKSFFTSINPPVNNLLCDAIFLELDASCDGEVFTNRGAFMQEGEAYGSCLPFPAGNKTVWFSFQAPESGAVIITTAFFETEILSEIVVYHAPENCENPAALGEEIACAPYGSNIFLGDLNSGETYYFKLAGAENTMGNFCVEVQTAMHLENIAFDEFLFYPNPVKNQLTLENIRLIDKVEIYNLKGQSLLQDHPRNLQTQLDLENLASGVYLMKVTVEGAEKHYRIIKQ